MRVESCFSVILLLSQCIIFDGGIGLVEDGRMNRVWKALSGNRGASRIFVRNRSWSSRRCIITLSFRFGGLDLFDGDDSGAQHDIEATTTTFILRTIVRIFGI